METEKRIISMRLEQLLKEKNFFPGIERAIHYYDYKDMLHAFRILGETINPEFKIDKYNKFVYENVAKWMVSDPTFKCNDFEGKIVKGDLIKGLYIGGGTGSGKTTLVTLMDKLVSIANIKFKVSNDTYYLTDHPTQASEICNEFSQDGDIQRYIYKHTLCINDLGAEPKEVLYMGNRMNCMREVIERRGDEEGLMTIITSNYHIGGQQLRERYGERASSRLKEMCNFLVLAGEDRRK